MNYLKPWVMNCPNGGLHSKRTVSSTALNFDWTEPWLLSLTRNSPRNKGVPQVWYCFNKCASHSCDDFPSWHQRDSTSNSVLQTHPSSSKHRNGCLDPNSAHTQIQTYISRTYFNNRHGADNPTLEKTRHETWRSNSQILQLAEASEEGQGPRRAVEPMMMMMMISIIESKKLPYTYQSKSDISA
jgi:hypothetical protein